MVASVHLRENLTVLLVRFCVYIVFIDWARDGRVGTELRSASKHWKRGWTLVSCGPRTSLVDEQALYELTLRSRQQAAAVPSPSQGRASDRVEIQLTLSDYGCGRRRGEIAISRRKSTAPCLSHSMKRVDYASSDHPYK